MRVNGALQSISKFHMFLRRMTYATKKVLLEIEFDIRILLNNLEDLNCLIDDLEAARELLFNALHSKLLPQVPHRHLHQSRQ